MGLTQDFEYLLLSQFNCAGMLHRTDLERGVNIGRIAASAWPCAGKSYSPPTPITRTLLLNLCKKDVYTFFLVWLVPWSPVSVSGGCWGEMGALNSWIPGARISFIGSHIPAVVSAPSSSLRLLLTDTGVAELQNHVTKLKKVSIQVFFYTG